MPFKYEEVVPWGRSFDEYCRMFDLTDADLSRSILGCADGPANFNAEMARRQYSVVSCDPLYHLSAGQIKQRIDATYKDVITQTRQNQKKFIWDVISSPDELGRLRLRAMSDFLGDFEAGMRDGRYIAAQLPNLPFTDSSFDLALCSHFLLFYSDSLSLDFHIKAVHELCRVAREVRLFPILTYNAAPSPFVDAVVKHLERESRRVVMKVVPYQFQRGGNVMLAISKNGLSRVQHNTVLA